ncbi:MULTISPECIES: malate dehydrogenase (quinone) [Enterobacterales]|jgi:malate dehydrogenase (quinone)|uniref:Probable malate:quinone oxidoreductase n=2 Tax=Pantoea TaxID=53335 RepID=A0A1I3YDU6_9GAMM|nr:MULTISPECIES: malate dehydrogenase (quinone) [Enterobacterales]MRT25668.1 malate dehydrogenase (quinone) [Enterobacteriaceae bacterium RIT697]KAJ9430331.1 malate dehydrogenase (quinone) [Pantoea sp. YR343]MBB3307817.1 malate dehydrogenase (quinone) [Enterobacter sp. Sphag1F]NYI16629.1 malate dehydrogenase (quinone) [Enterobacter sp. Sphag71]SFK30117.1 malate dehydrogenase (quinone) [Pantoea symbiotica]
MTHTKKIVSALSLAALLVSSAVRADDAPEKTDVLLIGGGIMSASLGTWLQELQPGWKQLMVEKLDGVALESSNGWNNAGTGHSANMELNYTPERADGSIDVSKALEINESFMISRQFWTSQVQRGVLHDPHSFINSTPHMSFVWGDKNVEYLTKRYDALQKTTLFQGMKFSTDHQQIQQWAPLVMEGRDPNQKVAATWTPVGTDVNYGEITRQLIGSLKKDQNFKLETSSEVTDFKRNGDNSWHVTIKDVKSGDKRSVDAKYVFIGAGGGAIKLLQKTGIPEADNYGGFPVGGSFLMTENPEIANRHLEKVYGQASVGAPPMSVPHIDSRTLDGKKVVLFGPFATFSTKYLKNGSLFDLLSATTTSNIMPMTHVGIDNFDLVKYLIGQVMLNDDDRFAALKEYYPNARKEDWKLIQAGQRVQIIKKDAEKGGLLKLGTEIVTDQQKTLAALLGASPGASTAAPITLDVMKKLFPEQFASPEWQQKIRAIVPSFGQKLNGNTALTQQVWDNTAATLLLTKPPVINMGDQAVAPTQAKPRAESGKQDMAL